MVEAFGEVRNDSQPLVERHQVVEDQLRGLSGDIVGPDTRVQIVWPALDGDHEHVGMGRRPVETGGCQQEQRDRRQSAAHNSFFNSASSLSASMGVI